MENIKKLLTELKRRLTPRTVRALVSGAYMLFRAIGLIKYDPLLESLVDAVATYFLGYGIFNNPTDKENF